MNWPPSEAPPPVCPPPASPPPVIGDGGRNSAGWILLAILFLLLIYASISGSFTRDEKKNKKEGSAYAQYEAKLEQAIKKRVLTKSLDRGGANDDKDLEDVIAAVLPGRTKDLVAARIYAIGRTELGKKLESGDLVQFTKSSDPKVKGLVSIYSPSPIKPEITRRAADALGDSYLDLVSKVQGRERAGDKKARELLQPGPLGALIIICIIPAFLGGLALWVYYFSQISKGKLKPLGFPTFLPRLADADSEALRAAAAFVGWLVVGGIASVATRGLGEMWSQVCASLAVLGCTILVLNTRIRGVKASWSLRIGDRKPLGRYVLWGLCGWLAHVPIFAITATLSWGLTQYLPPPDHPITEFLTKPSLSTLIAVFVTAALLAPLVEETLFRGMIAPAIARVLQSPLSGILISGFLFAAIHPQGISGWPPIFGLGAMAAFLAYQTRSLVPCFVLHAVHNGITLIVALSS